jgi:ribonucleoside-diphosphate reductase alpha chain
MRNKMTDKSEFRNSFGEGIFKHKYANNPDQTWAEKCDLIVQDVTEGLMPEDMRDQLGQYMKSFKFLPGGRYIYYAGQQAAYYNNCYLLKGEEDTREEWGRLARRSSDCLMSGGGIGIDYSVFRPGGSPLGRTGGIASGPIPLMNTINELGRNVMQGGSRRSAIYASLNWRHGDAEDFLRMKDWKDMEIHDGYSVWDAKQDNFNYHAPLDMTNVSLNYDNAFLDHVSHGHLPRIFIENCRQALTSGEPGFSFNFGEKENETLRNACREVTSADDSDVCNLGSVNMGAISTLEEFRQIVRRSVGFLVGGTITADLPYRKVNEVRGVP